MELTANPLSKCKTIREMEKNVVARPKCKTVNGVYYNYKLPTV